LVTSNKNDIEAFEATIAESVFLLN